MTTSTTPRSPRCRHGHRPTPGGLTTAVIDRVWLTVDEARQRTGVSKTEIYTALQTGDLVGTQRGKNHKWRIHVEDLDAWMRGTN